MTSTAAPAALSADTVAIYCGSLGTALVRITGPAADADRYDAVVIDRPVWMAPPPAAAARAYFRDLSPGTVVVSAGSASLTPLA